MVFRSELFLGVGAVVLGQQCQDVANFKDAYGYSCKDWDGWLCNTAVSHWEYRQYEEMQLERGCCATCKENREKCIDTPGFKDEEDYECTDWEDYSCYRAITKWNYSLEGAKALLKNCLASCHSCAYDVDSKQCPDDLTYEDEQGYGCGHWQEYKCGEAHSKWGYSIDGEHELREKCQFSCDSCGFGSECADNKDFEDEEGYRCGEWEGYDCNNAVSKWDYSEEGMRDLMEACKHTCGLCDSGDDNDDDSEEEEKPKGNALTFARYQELCKGASDDQKACKSAGCKYKNKNGGSCTMKKESGVKCKKIKEAGTCIAVGCDINAKGKCNGEPNFQ